MIFFFFKKVYNAVLEFSPKILYALAVADPFLLEDLFAGHLFYDGQCLGLPECIGNIDAAEVLLEFFAVVFVVAVSFEDKSDTGGISRLSQFFDRAGGQVFRWEADTGVQSGDIFGELDQVAQL